VIREEHLCWTAALNLSSNSPSISIYQVKPWFHSLVQVQRYCASAFEASKMRSAKTKRGLTSVRPWSTSIQGQRSKVSSRNTLSLSSKAQLFGFAFYGPEVKQCARFRIAARWPQISALTPKPSFLPIFEATSRNCNVYCNNGFLCN